MKIIDSKVEPLIQTEGLRGIYKQIELCGRTCYKSEDNITEDSCERFVKAMIKNNHTAMLEHGTVYLTIPDSISQSPIRYANNPYSRVKFDRDAEGKYCYFITTNYRVLVQNNWLDDLTYLTEPTGMHVKRYCFRIICDRGISHEIVRHRKMSFAQESTRYCNYNKDKFGNELTFIKPAQWEIKSPSYHTALSAFIDYLNDVEEKFFYLSQWLKPQEVRAILPNALKTEICVTGFEDDWEHFLDLRYKGTTGKPHPDMYVVAKQINDIIHG